ncbi:MAG: zinc ribbon domain-containing protein [Lachnospiraceae bacterium]|nr:zinc ribbon domain-containing protein [Lachnospiraceae bacterium]
MDIIDSIAKKGQELADKAKDIYDINKINIQIHNQEKEMNRQYVLLAKKYLEKYEQEIDPDFIEYVEKIQEHKELIEEYRLKIAVVKGNKVCSGCGKLVQDNAGYCQACGKKL